MYYFSGGFVSEFKEFQALFAKQSHFSTLSSPEIFFCRIQRFQGFQASRHITHPVPHLLT